jgi:putative addiction module component (TIGR02574 family)
VRPMPVTPEELARKAMELPAEGRAELADMLVESLDAAQLSRIDSEWLTEAKRRRDETRVGSVSTIPADEAMRQARDTLKR